ncbi:MAG: class A beta-lactamase [Rhodanobacter sp.]
MNRRNLLKGALACACTLLLAPAPGAALPVGRVVAQLSALERRHGGRLGVSMLDTGSGRGASWRGDERFLLCSTFKLLAVAAVLARVDHGTERLDRRVVFNDRVLLAYAPVTRLHVGPAGMSISELCAAAITVSDNTAANLLLDALGGPRAVTAFVRKLGDQRTRLDRHEPDLNVGGPGDLRDTTTPDAMLGSMRAVLLAGVLSVASRTHLVGWLRASTTGADKLRAGLPADWLIGDKTGSGAQGETNDVAIAYPPGRKPVIVTAYYAGSRAGAAERNVVLAQVGRIVAGMYGNTWPVQHRLR